MAIKTDCSVKKAIVEHSKKNIILCDASKLKSEGLYGFSNYDDLDMIILERKLTEKERNRFPDNVFFYSADK